MEIPAATLDMVTRDAGGKKVLVEGDVCNVVQRLQTLDSSLRVRYSEAQEYFVVYQVIGDEEHLVFTTTELDSRVVDRMQKIMHPSYNYSAELDRIDAAAEKEKMYQIDQQLEEGGEVIAHAARKDLGYWKDSSRSKRSWGKK